MLLLVVSALAANYRSSATKLALSARVCHSVSFILPARANTDEGCRKGKRECTYPGTSSSTKSNRSGTRPKASSADSDSSPSGDELDVDEREGLSIIQDEEEYDVQRDSEPSSATTDGRNVSEASLVSLDKSTSPTTETSSTLQRPTRPQAFRINSRQSTRTNISQNIRWAALPNDVKMYLKHHRDSLSNHHYAFKYDSGDFLKTTFLEIALNDQSQALLYAIVAFSAYHHTLARENARISHFLSYYNKSIILLQQSLRSKRPSVTTLLTILQLATIEVRISTNPPYGSRHLLINEQEFLGDWVNLLGHQRAAYQILTDLFTPQTITQDETRRKIIAWYIRFDLFAGIMAGGATSLDREWFASCHEFYRRQARDRPEDLGARFEEYFATSRLLATDVTLLLATKSKHEASDEQFASQSRELIGQYERFRHMLETTFSTASNYIKSFPRAPSPNDVDITDFRDPNFLYGGELFTMNYILIDFWSIELMFKHQLATAQQQQPPAELIELALNQCKMFEAIEYCDQGSPGALLACQASLGIASLFLPKTKRYIDWCRRKFTLIEQMG